MSVDTITRVNAYFKAQIEDIFPVYTIYDNDNLGLPESSDGPMVKIFVEPSIDNILTDNALYQEDGVIIAQLFVEVGQSSLVLNQIADDIKEAFRQVTLQPTLLTELSVIQFEDVEFANAGTIPKESGGTIEWKRYDVFVTYSKYDCQTSPFFVSTWDTENLGGTGSATKTIVLPMSAGNLVDWGDGTIDNTNTHEYSSGGVKTIKIDGEITGFRFNDGGDKSKLLTISATGGLVIDNNSMFYGCDSMTLWGNENTVTTSSSMVNMFRGCTSLLSLDVTSLNTSSVASMEGMFQDCTSLTSLDVSSFNTSSVTNMSFMFRNCTSLTSLDVSSFNTSSVASMEGMFRGCSSLTSLDVTSLNTSSVTNMSFMFRGCSSLTSLDVSSFNTSSVASMSIMFFDCSSLISIDVSSFDTSSVTNMSFMFSGCSSLTTLTDVEDFNITLVTNMSSFIFGVTLPTTQYDQLLINYEAQSVQNNVSFSGGNSQYSAGAAATARQALIDDHTWTITDGGQA